MRSQHLAMTWEEFERLPAHPGWKHEYLDGQAHISPRKRFAVVTIEVKPRLVRSPTPIRPVAGGDRPGLVSAYIEAFSDTVEYCDWEPQAIEESARKAIREFLAGRRGEVLPASRVAVDERDQAIVGAALLVRAPREVPLLDMLFVGPRFQRLGIADALVSSALAELHCAGERILESTYHLGNDASRAWHQRFGFVEEPDLLLAELYWRLAGHELERRAEIGDLTEPERAALEGEEKRWRTQVEALRKVAEEQGRKAVMPALRGR